MRHAFRKIIFLGILAGFLMALPAGWAAVAEKSIGTQAGETARDMRANAEENYAKAIGNAGTATQEFQSVAQVHLKNFEVQLQESWKNFQNSALPMLQNFEEEWRKFLEALNQPASK
jgi:hypothetical protein